MTVISNSRVISLSVTRCKRSDAPDRNALVLFSDHIDAAFRARGASMPTDVITTTLSRCNQLKKAQIETFHRRLRV